MDGRPGGNPHRTLRWRPVPRDDVRLHRRTAPSPFALNPPSRQRSLTSDYAYALVARAASVVSSAARLPVLTARWLGALRPRRPCPASHSSPCLWDRRQPRHRPGNHLSRRTRWIHRCTSCGENAPRVSGIGLALAIIGYLSRHPDSPRLPASARGSLPSRCWRARHQRAVSSVRLLLGAQLIREYNILLIVYSAIQLLLIGCAARGGSLGGALFAASPRVAIWLSFSLRSAKRLGPRTADHTNWTRRGRAVFAYDLRSTRQHRPTAELPARTSLWSRRSSGQRRFGKSTRWPSSGPASRRRATQSQQHGGCLVPRVAALSGQRRRTDGRILGRPRAGARHIERRAGRSVSPRLAPRQLRSSASCTRKLPRCFACCQPGAGAVHVLDRLLPGGIAGAGYPE